MGLSDNEVFGVATSGGGLSDEDVFGAAAKKPQPKRSAIGEVANQGYAGIVSDLPKMAGQAIQYASDPGNQAYEIGKGIADWGEEQGRRADLQPQEDQHGTVTNALAAGARMVPQSVAPAAAVGLGLAGAAAASPALAVSGLAGLGIASVLGSAPAAMAQGQETLDRGLEAGLPKEKALEAARINAAIEGGGETVGTFAGGKLLGIGAKAVGKVVGAGAQGGAGAALKTITDPATIRPWLAQIPKTAATEVGTEMAQGGGQTAVENAYGISDDSPWEAAKHTIAPTLGMTALLAPFGLAGFGSASSAARQRAEILASPEASVEQRAQVAQGFYAQLAEVDPTAAKQFASNAVAAIRTGAPLTLDESMFAEPGQQPPAPPAPPAASAGATPAELVAAASAEEAAAEVPAGPISKAVAMLSPETAQAEQAAALAAGATSKATAGKSNPAASTADTKQAVPAVAPISTKAPEANSTFSTAKGSEYTLHNDGTTTRNKAARPEHPGEEGLQERSKSTFFVSNEDMQKLDLLNLTEPRTGLVVNEGDGTIGVRYLSGPDVGKIERNSVIKYQKAPAVGLHPVEAWGDGKTVHFGNAITSIQKGEAANGNQAEVTIPPEAGQPAPPAAVPDADGTASIAGYPAGEEPANAVQGHRGKRPAVSGAAQGQPSSSRVEGDAAEVAGNVQGTSGKSGKTSGKTAGRGWQSFPADSGTRGIPRAEMPQIKSTHRGAMVQFLKARGIEHRQEEVAADSVRPTQAEYSPEKVMKAAGFTGVNRSILVSSDGYVLDGHHQWLAGIAKDAPIKVIRLNAPIKRLVDLAREFPSSTKAGGAAPTDKQSLSVAPTTSEDSRQTAVETPQLRETPNVAPAIVEPAINLSSRSAEQLAHLSTNGRNGYKEAAIAELDKRAGKESRKTGKPENVEAATVSGDAGKAGKTGKPENLSAITSRQSPIQKRDDLIGAIMRVTGGDGIHTEMARDTTGDDANRSPKLRGLFTPRGTQDLGDTAMLLRNEEGYDVRDGAHLAALIRQAAGGDVAVSMERAHRDKEADKEARHRDMIRRTAKRRGLKVVGVKFSALEAQVLAMLEARSRKAAEQLDARSVARLDAAIAEAGGLVSEQEIDAVLADMSRRGLASRDFWNEGSRLIRGMAQDARIAQQEKEYAEQTQGELDTPWLEEVGDGRGDSPVGVGSPVGEGDQAPSGDGFNLEGQSAADVDRQEADRVAAEKAAREAAEKEAKAKKDAEQKALDEKVKARTDDPDNFVFGEDGKAAANPTGGLFDQPAAVAQEPVIGYDGHPGKFGWAENEVGGAVIYSSGDIALVEGFSPLGNAVYAGVKGDSRTRADISAYTGKMFSETEKAELEKAKADHVKEQGRLHEKAPEGPFSNGARFAKSESVSDELAGVAQKWLGLMGIKSRVFLATKGDVSSKAAIDRYGLRGPFSAVRSAGTQNDADGSKRTLPNGDHYIILPRSARKSQALEALAHEIGHILEADEWSGADRATKDAVMADYQKWLNSAGNTKAADWVKQLRAHTSGKLTHVATSETADRLPPYWRSFSEYFADQVSRWATTTDRPLTVVDAFFRRVALAMRRLYAKAAGKPYLPGQAMKAYLDARALASPLELPSAPAEKAPATPQLPQAADASVSAESLKLNDNIKFTPHTVSKLTPVVQGILVQKESTSNGYRLRIRTDEPSPTGGENITWAVYSNNGAVSMLPGAAQATALDQAKTKHGGFSVGDGVTDIFLLEDGIVISIDGDGVATIANMNGTESKSDGANLEKYVRAEFVETPIEQPAATAETPKAAEPEQDLDALFDAALIDVFGEALGETKPEKVKKAKAPKSVSATRAPKKTAAKSAVSAAKNTGMGLADVAKGLNALFKPKPGSLGTGPHFDEKTYAEAKPYFIAGIQHFKQAGADVADMMRSLITALRDQFGMDKDTIVAMKPYVVKFMGDVKDGTVNYDEVGTDQNGEGGDRGTESESGKALEGVSPGEVGGTGPQGPGGRGSDQSGDGSGAGNPAVDGRRGEDGRSGGDSPAGSHPAEAGAKGEDAGGKTEGPGVPGDLRNEKGSIPEANFEIGEDVGLGAGGQAAKYRDNVAAIKVLKTIEADRRRATAAEKAVLAKYVGWGGISNAFRNRVTGEAKADWLAKVEELESLLSPAELRAASASTRNAHFTAKDVVDFMWQAARRLGFNGGMVLEPSVGVGNFVGLMPREVSGNSFVTGIELDSLTSRMAGALYPRSNVVNSGFQELALPEGAFSLAIGNPPFGSESLRFQHRPELNAFSIHNQFFLGSIDTVEPGGLMAMVVSRYLLDAQDSAARQQLARRAELVGAVRLPGSAFKGNALTDVVTDVLFFRRRTAEDEARIASAAIEARAKVKKGDFSAQARKEAAERRLAQAMEWTGTEKVKDPLGGEDMIVGAYFARNPSMIVGTMDRSGSMQHGADIDVKLAKGEKLADRLGALLDRLPRSEARDFSAEAIAKAEEMHKALGEALELSASGAEVGSIRYETDGSLSVVVERINDNGDGALKKLAVTPETPWSPNLFMNLAGQWYLNVPKLKADGTTMKSGRFVVYTKAVFANDSAVPAKLRLGQSKFERVKKLITLRDLFVKQIGLEVSRAPKKEMEANRDALRAAHESFVAKHGYVSEPKNASIVAQMPDEGLLLSLESGFRREVTPDKAKATGMPAAKAKASPAAILSRPVAVPPVAAETAASASDALAISMAEIGRVSMPRVAALLGVSEEAAAKQLTEGDKPLAFVDPEQGMAIVDRNAYLSGSVRRKLAAAKDEGLAANVAELERIQPEQWSSDQVNARLGANWIPAAVYSEFASKLLGSQASVTYSELTNTFQTFGDFDSAAATATWGTERVSFPELLTATLNSSRIAVYQKNSDGSRTFLQTETDSALDKRREIMEAFDEWIFKDAPRRKELTQLFNDRFNTRVNRQHDGSHLTFPGKVPDGVISLRRGQKNGVWRGVTDAAVLYDHAVGAGKTFVGIARAMERRRMGLSKKPMFVVPNHLVSEWAAQAYRLYPAAKILAAGSKDLEAKNRRRLFAKIASGDWDMVIVPHSSFAFIDVSPATEERFLNEQLEQAGAALKEAEEDADPSSRFKPLSVKAAEALISKLEDRLAASKVKKRDRLLTFEQMGVDDLTVDESHEFKNLFYSTRQTDIRGMGPATGSAKALDLYTKVRTVRDAGGSIAFMTGTPISNSAVEMYTLMRYLAPETLEDTGLEHFDAFRAQYVDASSALETTDSGVGLKAVTRLGRSWSNMRGLMDAYYSVADVVTNDDIKAWYAEDNPGKEFPLPKIKGGKRRDIAVPPTPTQLRILMDDVLVGFDSLKNIDDIKERNATRLRLMDRARKLALHAKAVDKSFTDEAGGKLDVAVGEIAEIFHKWTPDKGTQLVFLDRGLPKSAGDGPKIKQFDALKAKADEALAGGDEAAYMEAQDSLAKFDENEIEELRAAQNGGWNAYQHIKDGLIAKGVPENTIAFVQDYNSDIAKRQLFEAVNDGTIRVLIGSTPRMGAGTNVQERLVALHHIDATWKPSDIEQREGRIIRQGNALLEKYGDKFEIEIIAYATERTVDAKLWSLNATKLQMVNGIRYYDGQFEMDFEDEAAVGMAEMAAIASGDPLLLERFRLTSEVDALLRQKRSHSRRVESSEDALSSAKRTVADEKSTLDRMAAGGKAYDEAMAVVAADVATRKVTINGVGFAHATRFYADKAVHDAFAAVAEGEKFSITIDGQLITTKGGAETAVEKALGDATAFFAEAGGKRFNVRSDFARSLRDITGHEFLEIKETDAGSIAGIPVEVSTETSYGGTPYVVLSSVGKVGGESISVSVEVSSVKKAKGAPALITVQNLRQLTTDFEKRIDHMEESGAARNYIARSAERARADIPALELAVKEPFKHAEELETKKARLRVVEEELNGRDMQSLQARQERTVAESVAPAAGAIAPPRRLSSAQQGRMPPADGLLFNQVGAANISVADSAVYDMAADGSSAADILGFIAGASHRSFNRYLAKALAGLGVKSSISLDSQGGWKFNRGKAGAKYAAAYNPTTDAVALFTPREAERHVLHELVHAATLKAIGAGGPAAVQMRALFNHLRARQGSGLAGQYGMESLDEFVAEAFSNPQFQQALDKLPAPAGSGLKSAWQAFVRVVARLLGLTTARGETLLSETMRIGARLMRENAALGASDGTGNVRGNVGGDISDTITIDGVERPRLNSNGRPIAQTDEALRKFYAWFKNSRVVDEQGRPLVVYHGTASDVANFAPGNGSSDGFHFSSSPDVASRFAQSRAMDGGKGANVVPAYLSMQNPKAVAIASNAEISDAQEGGHDGLAAKGGHYVAIGAEQIKSATGNTGEFSPDNPDIRFNIAGTLPAPAPTAGPVAAGNLWQRAKARAAKLLKPGTLDKVIYEMQDKFIDLRRLRDHIQKIGGAITDMNDAYLGEELYHKRLAHRTETFAEQELQPLIAELRRSKVGIEEFETFLHARHAPEANAEMAKRNPNQAEIDAGHQAAKSVVTNLENHLQRAQKSGAATAAIERALNAARGELADWNGAQAFRGTKDERLSLSGMSDADARLLMSGLSVAKRATLDALAARVDAINAGTMQLLDDYGLMSKDVLRTWGKTYQHYVPLHRDEAHPDSLSHPIGQGFSTKGDAAKRRTGSNAKVTNILGHIAMQRESALTRGEKNHVMLKLYLMARQNPLPDVWSVGKVPTIDTIDKATGFVRSVPDPLYKTRPNTVMLRLAGKDVAVTMNENNPEALRMAHALKNLDVDDLHYLIPVIGKATRWFASINTQYNPIFGVVNMMRDTQEAALNLSTTPLAGKQGEVFRDSLSILGEVVKNKGRMPKTGKWAALFDELREVGGTTGFRDLFLDADSRSKALLGELNALDRGNAGRAWEGVKRWLSDYNEAMENATRLAAYKAARDHGMSKERAASLAKNLTVNFNRKGRQTRELGALYAFFNAAVQGTARMAQTLSGPAGRKIMAGGVALGALNAMLGLAVMGGQDDDGDDWEKIPEFIKQRSVIIPIGGQDYITIPMPLGFQFLPNIGRLFVEGAVYKDKTVGTQLASLVTILADAFNPLGGSAPPLQIITPTVMDPFVALAQNKDWTGNPIYRENRNSLDPDPGFKRGKDSATPWAKLGAEMINTLTGGTEYVPGGWSPSPDQIDYVIGQLTGGVGREAGKVAATVAAPFTGEELPPYKIPLAGRLYGNTSGASGESQTFYANITRANEAENEIKGRQKDGQSLADYLSGAPHAVELAARGNVAERHAALLRKQRSEITKQDGPDKVAKVRELNTRLATVMRNFNKEAARLAEL